MKSIIPLYGHWLACQRPPLETFLLPCFHMICAYYLYELIHGPMDRYLSIASVG
jgi:hypothetical protein